MKGFFAAIRFLLACTVIFGSGYFFAKPHNGADRTFAPVFDHYAANLAFWSSLILSADKDLRLLGCAIALGLAALSAIYGVKTHSEMFVIYACVYGVIALDIAVVDRVPDLAALFIMMSSIVSVVSLFLIHAHMQAHMRKEEG